VIVRRIISTAKSKSRASELVFRAALMLGSGNRLRQRSTCMHATRTVSVHEMREFTRAVL
jgi:hypothetical protein